MTQNKKKNQANLIASLLHIFGLCIVVILVSISVIHRSSLIGWALIFLGLFCLASLSFLKISLKSLQPDIIFGIIDNGILVVTALFGAHFAGVSGAVVGGVVGNALTDGIAGVFEGYSAEKLRSLEISEQRTVLKSAVGKMAGCLLGAGFVLMVVEFLF